MLATVGVVIATSVVAAVAVVLTSLKVYFTFKAGHCSSTMSMVGKTVIVTGSTAGIGKETARDLLQRGARVILACRNLEKGDRVASELRSDAGSVGEVVVHRLDTSDLTSVRTFARKVLEAEKAIHVLINNAGILPPKKRQVTADGLELTMATNHFGHFLLTNLLLGLTVNSLHPGVVRTELISKRWNFLSYLTSFFMFFTSKDAASGAQTSIHLAVSEEVEGVTGRYFADCKEATTSELARSKDLANGLWEASVKAVGLEQHEIHGLPPPDIP